MSIEVDLYYARIRAKDFSVKSEDAGCNEDSDLQAFLARFNAEREKELRKAAFCRGSEGIKWAKSPT